MDGILAVNKARGLTSHDVVFKLRKIYKTKKIGHTGTLDPEVNGVLPICIGNATRISEYMMDTGKEYVAEVTLGIQTTTEDQTGEVVCQKSVAHVTDDMLADAFDQLTGWIDQTPPMYSAVKVNGRKLYEYARNNETVERPSRKVFIESIELQDDIRREDDKIIFTIKVKCGKGTYIRTLATQIAEHVNTAGHMSRLTRTKSGGFTLSQSYSLEELMEMDDNEKAQILRPMADGLSHLPHYIIDEAMLFSIQNGQKLRQLDPPLTEETVMVYEGKPLAIYMPHPEKEGTIKARKVFNH